MIVKSIFEVLKILFLPGFLLNFIWESLQSDLYHYHFNGLMDFVMIHIRASLGDIVTIFLIYLLGYYIYNDYKLFAYQNKIRVLYIILAGLVAGITIEKICLKTDRWSYNQAIAIIPLIKVGLSPVLQMTILPLATFAIAKRLLKSR